MNDERFINGKATESKSVNFLRTVLTHAGYEVRDLGIETHNLEILALLKGHYEHNTNRQLLSMPDLVVLDPDTHQSWRVEVKSKLNFKYIRNGSPLEITYHRIEDYINYWVDGVLVFVIGQKPYFYCVPINQIRPSQHHVGKKRYADRPNVDKDIWKFYGLYKPLNAIFPRVNPSHLAKAEGNKLLSSFG